MVGLMVVNGATAGGFSPISVFGSIVNGVVENNALAENATLLFVSSFVFNLLLSVVVFFMFGGRELLRREGADGEPTAARFERREGGGGGDAGRPAADGRRLRRHDRRRRDAELDRDKIFTLIGSSR